MKKCSEWNVMRCPKWLGISRNSPFLKGHRQSSWNIGSGIVYLKAEKGATFFQREIFDGEFYELEMP